MQQQVVHCLDVFGEDSHRHSPELEELERLPFLFVPESECHSRSGGREPEGCLMEDDQERFAVLLGRAALSVWGDMPRDIQEALFETAMKGNDSQREAFARLLHARHPRTLHPPRPG
jgi:hypothetical protein